MPDSTMPNSLRSLRQCSREYYHPGSDEEGIIKGAAAYMGSEWEAAQHGDKAAQKEVLRLVQSHSHYDPCYTQAILGQLEIIDPKAAGYYESQIRPQSR